MKHHHGCEVCRMKEILVGTCLWQKSAPFTLDWALTPTPPLGKVPKLVRFFFVQLPLLILYIAENSYTVDLTQFLL